MRKGVHKLTAQCRQCTTYRQYQTKSVRVFGYNPENYGTSEGSIAADEAENSNVTR